MAENNGHPLGRFTLGRSLTSYTRVHLWASKYVLPFIRNKAWLVCKGRWAGREYLNIGCGYNLYDGFVNMDYIWKPGVLCWDISRLEKEPFPFADGTFKGIYTEHCLEHVDLKAGWNNVREYFRLLKPGGHIRDHRTDGIDRCMISP